jgi:hypothetical protein
MMYIVARIISEFLPNIQLSCESLSKFSDFDDSFFLLSISIYSEIIAPATRQKVIELIDLQLRKIRALEIMMISLAGLE